MLTRTDSPDFLITGKKQSFVSGIAASLESAQDGGSVTAVASTASAVRPQAVGDTFDAVIVTDRAASRSHIGELIQKVPQPVLLVADSSDQEMIRTALEGGVVDVLPRVDPESTGHLIAKRTLTPGPTGQINETSPDQGFASESSQPVPYRTAFEQASDGMIIHTPGSGEIIAVNEKFCEIDGRDREDVVGKDARAALRTDRDWYEAVQAGSHEVIECQYERPNGRTVPVEVRSKSLRTDDDSWSLTTIRKITERKRRESEFKELFNGVNDAITVHDPETTEIERVNDTFCEMVGYSREELEEMEISDFSREDLGYTTERGRQFIRGVVESGEADQTEWALETADGKTKWIEVHAGVIELGGQERFIAIDRDITEAKRREREYEQIFHSVNDSIVVHDPETGEMIDANETFCTLVGYDRETVLELGTPGVSVQEEGYTQARAEEIIERVADEGSIPPFEWKVETASGDQRQLEVTATQTEIGGESRHVSLMRDITERQQLERSYEEVFDKVASTITLHEPGNPVMQDVNESLCELLGYEKEDLVDTHPKHITPDLPGYDVERIESVHERASQDDGQRQVEWPLETREGEIRWIEATLQRVSIEGQERVLTVGREITEAKQRAREYEQIFNGVPDPITVNHPETAELLDVNDALCDILGYDKETILEKGNQGLGVNEEGYTDEQAKEIVQRVMESGEPETFEWKLETADGDHRVLEVTGKPAVIGGEDRYVSLTRDITERKKRESAITTLQEATNDIISKETPEKIADIVVDASKEILRASWTVCWLSEAETDHLVPAAAAGSIQDINDISEIPPGWPEYEAFNRDDSTTHPVDMPSVDRSYDDILLIPLEDEGLLAVGDYHSERAEALLDTAKVLADNTATALDRANRAAVVREREQRFRMIAERVDEIIYLSTRDFSEVLYVNEAYEDIWGRPIEELYEDPTSFIDGIDRRDREQFLSDFGPVIAGDQDDEEDREFELRIRQPNGDIRWVDAHGYPVTLENGEQRYIGIIKDITSRKRREQRLQVFNRVLRHDLRNQLTVIKSHAEALADQTDNEYTKKIIEAADRLNDIGTRARSLDTVMSREVNPTETDVVSVLRDVFDRTEASVESLDTDLPDEAKVVTDAKILKSILLGGIQDRFRASESSVEISLETTQTGCVVTVSDDGYGIPEMELKALRQGTETELQHVRGIGLWQLKWGADKLNGDVTFDTDNGTTLEIRIPDFNEERADGSPLHA